MPAVPEPAGWEPSVPALALCRDARLEERLRRGERWYPEDHEAPAFSTGNAAALYLGGTAAALAAASRFGDLGHDPAFAAGAAQGERWLFGRQRGRAIDEGSRLCDELEPAPPPMRLPTRPLPVHDHCHAEWDLLAETVSIAGAASGVELRGARLAWDELRTDVAYAWLGCPGRSTIVLECDVPAPVEGRLHLRFEGQQGLRGCYPFGGEALLVVRFDGVELAQLRDDCSTGQRTVPLPLPGITQGRHVFEIALAPGSTTTSRVYRAWID
jgi:hypothetical protein